VAPPTKAQLANQDFLLPFSQPRIFSIRLLIPRRSTCRIELTRTAAAAVNRLVVELRSAARAHPSRRAPSPLSLLSSSVERHPAESPVKRYVVRMGQRAIHGFFSLSRNVRLLWFFALFEALNIGVHLIAR
jgi:hypothetical protein